MPPHLSIIVPALNEAGQIEASLTALQPLRCDGCEVILVDGGSTDSTCSLAQPLVDRLVNSQPGRALQMNTGAMYARADALLFLHADTHLPKQTPALLRRALTRDEQNWGYFDVRLSGTHPMFRIIEALMNRRSRLTGIATGDQALFVRQSLFAKVNGFPQIPLMEDIALSQRLKQHSPPAHPNAIVVTSSRRWEKHGIARTILLMWWLRLSYWLGTDPAQLQRLYRDSRSVPDG